MGDSVRYFLVVWDFKEVVPCGRRRFRTQVVLSCEVVARTFTNRELPVSIGLKHIALIKYICVQLCCLSLPNYHDERRRTVLLGVSTHRPFLTWGPWIDVRVVHEIIGKKLQFHFH